MPNSAANSENWTDAFGAEKSIIARAFFSTDFGFDKYDQVFVPEFNWGAMENVGCVVLREEMLFSSPPSRKELFGRDNTLVHELAHMWFGNLVTMDWWDDLWLNEAFATFMATMCSDKFNPEWKRWNQFSLERSMAFDVDSLENTRPIEFEVKSPVDAEGMFDLLTYEKLFL